MEPCGYKLLIWPFGSRIESRRLEKIRAWVEGGGMLLVRNLAAVRTVEGKPIEAHVGKGRVVDAGGSLDRLAELVRTRDSRMTGLPPLDARRTACSPRSSTTASSCSIATRRKRP